jgi:nicotinamidase-related amidase
MPSILSPDTAALAIIDWQERLFPAMDESHRVHALARAVDLAWLSRSLDMPVLTSEQYPRGLGSTLPALEVRDAIAKTHFSALGEPAFVEALKTTERRQIILVGMETHICVAQTCRDLLSSGYEVWTIADCCLSRRELDWTWGCHRMAEDGARVVTAEAALFELLGVAEGPLFKELSRRIR